MLLPEEAQDVAAAPLSPAPMTRLAAPNFTSALTTVCTLARTNDYLQLAYDHFKNNA